MGKTKAKESQDVAEPLEPIPRADAVARLRTDFDRYYFVTGQMDLDLYEEDCTFADPFVAFEGRQRFKVRLSAYGWLEGQFSPYTTTFDGDCLQLYLFY